MFPPPLRPATATIAAATCALLLASACDRRRAGEGGPSRPDAGGPLGSASTTAATQPAVASSAGDRDEGPALVPPSGGPWATCFDGFRISGQPLRDVTRLGLLCGPATGMRRPEPPEKRALSPGEAWTFDVPLAAGECLRLVVAASTATPLVVTTSGAPLLASTVRADEGWLVARPKSPLCAEQAASVRVVIRSAAGAEVAVGRWFLPP